MCISTVSLCQCVLPCGGGGEPDFDKIYFEAPKSGLDFRQRNLLKEEEEENKTKKLHVWLLVETAIIYHYQSRSIQNMWYPHTFLSQVFSTFHSGFVFGFVLRILQLVKVTLFWFHLYGNLCIFIFYFFQSLWVRVYSRIHQAQKRLVEDACCTCIVCLLLWSMLSLPFPPHPMHQAFYSWTTIIQQTWLKENMDVIYIKPYLLTFVAILVTCNISVSCHKPGKTGWYMGTSYDIGVVGSLDTSRHALLCILDYPSWFISQTEQGLRWRVSYCYIVSKLNNHFFLGRGLDVDHDRNYLYSLSPVFVVSVVLMWFIPTPSCVLYICVMVCGIEKYPLRS